MTGKSHLFAGAASVMLADGVLHLAAKLPVLNFLKADAILNGYHGMFIQGVDMFASAGWCASSALLFAFGTLLPDIDTGKSMIRKILHMKRDTGLPESFHRTWTHSVWAVVLLWMVSVFVPILFWLAFGYTAHIFWDAFSSMGVCFFYPIQQYRCYPGGARVAKGHKLKFYRTGSMSEYVFVSMIFAAGLVLLLMQHFGMDISFV